MRTPQDITVDRALLLYLLQLAESQECEMVSDVWKGVEGVSF